MGIVVPFPIQQLKMDSEAEFDYQSDPYYQFLEQVLSVSDSLGYQLPNTVKMAAHHVYIKTRHTSQLAQFINKQN